MAPAARRGLAYALGGAAVALLVWSAVLAISGGFDTTFLGLPIRSHNARRPAQWGLVALALFVATRGVRRTWTELTAAAIAANDWLTRVRLPYRWIAIGLALAMAIFVWCFGIFVAGGSDSYGYLSQAQFWRQGVPILPQPLAADAPWPNATWTMAPLGYRHIPGTTNIVPTYAVGLPLFLAGVQAIAGYTAIFFTWPVAGAALVLASYALGRALGSPAAGLVAAWLMATDRTLLAEVTVPMADVPPAAALAICCYFLFRSSGPAALRAGLAAAVAVLIRPNFAGTVAVLALWLALQPLFGSRVSWRAAVGRAVVFAAAAVPGFVIVALANRALYGSPFISGYGDLGHIYSWANVLTNLYRYPALIVQTYSVLLFAGLVAVCLPTRRLWRGVEDRSVFAGIALFVASVLAQFMAFEPAVNPGYLRYILPIWPLLYAGAALLLLRLAAPGWRGAALGTALVVFGTIAPSGAFSGDGRSERKYPQAAAIVREHAAPSSVVFAMQHSGSVRYYAGLTTVRYDVLEHDWLDRAVAWLQARGIHTYAVLDDWEVPKFREHFAGQLRVAALDRPAFIYQGAVATHIFDVSSPLEGRPPTVIVQDTFGGPRAVPPAMMQGLRTQR